MDWTTVARVNTRRGKTDATANTDVLQPLITETSADAEAFIGHKAEAVARTEVYELCPGKREIWLRAYPIVSIANIWLSASTDFSAVTPVAVDGYSKRDEQGMIRLLTGAYWDPTYVQVEYTGGMGATTAAFMTAYPSLAAAVEEQVIAAFLRVDSPARKSTRVAQGNMEYEGAHDLLPNVKRRLTQHRRAWIV